MRIRRSCFAAALVAALLVVVRPAVAHADPPPPLAGELQSVERIWDQGTHNAFTDLLRTDDAWYCVFREGEGHAGDKGDIRVLRSEDGEAWESAALLTHPTRDLRDAKLSVTPNGRLMMVTVGPDEEAEPRFRSFVTFSDDGSDWTELEPVIDPNYWLWRVTWHDGTAYGVAYATDDRETTRLYRSEDGKDFETHVPELFSKATHGKGYPNETGKAFLDDGTFVLLLRRDADSRTAFVGTAQPPYTDWTWHELDRYVGGPVLLRVELDGTERLIAAGRRLDPDGASTVLYELRGVGEENAPTLHELVTLPSGGDTSYPGLVWHDGTLWMSYYSSHEPGVGTSIYLAKIALTAGD